VYRKRTLRSDSGAQIVGDVHDQAPGRLDSRWREMQVDPAEQVGQAECGTW
jgi:hypothetical protein